MPFGSWPRWSLDNAIDVAEDGCEGKVPTAHGRHTTTISSMPQRVQHR